MIVRDLRSKVWFAIGPAQQSVERVEEDARSTNAGTILIRMVVNNDDDDENENDDDEEKE